MYILTSFFHEVCDKHTHMYVFCKVPKKKGKYSVHCLPYWDLIYRTAYARHYNPLLICKRSRV